MKTRILTVAAAAAFCASMAAAQQVRSVTVPGQGSVGIGVMSGGTVNVGPTKAELESALKASGAEQNRLLRDITAKLNVTLAQVSSPSPQKPPTDEFSATIVNGFLATVVGKKVPKKDWPRVFNELARKFLETGSRIAATPITSDKINELVARADVARKTNDFGLADRLLEEAETQAISDAGQRKEEFRNSSRQAASLLASRASLAFTRLEREKGAQLLERAFKQRSDDVSLETLLWLIEAGDAWTTSDLAPGIRTP